MACMLHHKALSIIVFLKTIRTPLHFTVQRIEPSAKMCETEGQPYSLLEALKAISPYARREYCVIICFGRYEYESLGKSCFN